MITAHGTRDLQDPFSSSFLAVRRGRKFSPPNCVKLAAEPYDSDDDLVRRSPPLERTFVNPRPSPSPDYLPPPESSPTPERISRLPTSKRRTRRPKAQASQGDAVLIGFMGGLNHPDLASKAGEEPLPQESDESMDDDDEEPTNRESGDGETIKLARTAVSIVERCDARRDDQHGTSNNESAKPARLKIQTRTDSPATKDTAYRGSSSSQAPYHKASEPVTNGVPKSKENETKRSPSSSRSKSPSTGDADSAALSPMVRRFTIPNSERPTEALPAMQNSPASSSAKSPNNQQSLPSLRQIQLEPLMGNGPTRSPFAMGNGPVNASPMSSIAPRPPQYPSPQSGVNGGFHGTSPYNHHSPSHSSASPSTNMSPPGKPVSQGYFPSGRTPQSEESTPQSAVSHRSSSSFSTAPSPHAHPMESDRPRSILPPLPMPSQIMTGSFKCDHPGCTAAPFQTQYLLNSHANVHSQVRPHYCPVPHCPRSEAGKGFKRKNEMIRHGLVHESPGYICPFCPEREHKYPRPDNLQRHVRVNHPDKDTNDAQLRDVLAQRCEGGNRGRRRRLGSG